MLRLFFLELVLIIAEADRIFIQKLLRLLLGLWLLLPDILRLLLGRQGIGRLFGPCLMVVFFRNSLEIIDRV